MAAPRKVRTKSTAEASSAKKFAARKQTRAPASKAAEQPAPSKPAVAPKRLAATPKKTAATPKKLAATQASSKPRQAENPASRLIDQRIRELGGWRGATLLRMRALIAAADPKIVEEWKWLTPVWSHDGIVCTGEAYKSVVKLTFARGASLPDPTRLFNSSLGGNTRRAIDIREGEKLDERAFKALVKAAVAKNAGTARKPAR